MQYKFMVGRKRVVDENEVNAFIERWSQNGWRVKQMGITTTTSMGIISGHQEAVIWYLFEKD